MDKLTELQTSFLYALELHDHIKIGASFDNGLDPESSINDQSLLEHLIGMYTRSTRFSLCVHEILKVNPDLADPLLTALLLDDAKAIKDILDSQPSLINRTYNFATAYIPLEEASLLHICAEFNLVEVLKVLLEKEMDVDIKAGTDRNGFGGQTPIYHTVNQNQNASFEAMKILLSYGADIKSSIKGLIWGENLAWSTFIPAVNPISFAMMGNLPQMHRNQIDIAENIRILVKNAWDLDYNIPNIPNKYLAS